MALYITEMCPILSNKSVPPLLRQWVVKATVREEIRSFDLIYREERLSECMISKSEISWSNSGHIYDPSGELENSRPYLAISTKMVLSRDSSARSYRPFANDDNSVDEKRKVHWTNGFLSMAS